MSIVNSTFTLDGHLQKDGRQYVREVHVDNVGISYVIDYLADANADFTAIMNARAAQIAANLITTEISVAITVDVTPILKYATLSQLGQFVRAEYKDLSGVEIAILARWIVNRINDGTFTDAQVQNAFNLTITQYNNLKTKWQNLKTDYEACTSAVGE